MIFETIKYTLILIFILVIFYILGTMIVGGYIYPMFRAFKPTNETQGISQDVYLKKTDFLVTGMKIIFYIILAIPFVLLIMKLLYEREETSIYGW